MSAEWLRDLLFWLAEALGTDYLTLKPVLTILLVCTLCGMVGSQVVGNRMAFFSDTMAHAAFAGVALGSLTAIILAVPRLIGPGEPNPRAELLILLVMVLFGGAVGVAIVSTREGTGLSNDTIIGVFFAAAIGFGAMLFPLVRRLGGYDPEGFLFGSPVFVVEEYLLNLAIVGVLTAGVVGWRYNQMMFASFHTSLARTRRINLRLNNYLFIVLLALVVNLSIKAVGALLINALLVVPAATAASIAGNLRQMFWLTIAYCVAAGLAGYAISTAVDFGPSGTIVVVSVVLFFGSWGLARFLGRAPVRTGLR